METENSIAQRRATCRRGQEMATPIQFIISMFSFHAIRSIHPWVFLGKGVLKISSKFTGEHPCGSAIYWNHTLLNSHLGMGVLLWICCIFSEHLFFRTPLGGCFCTMLTQFLQKYKQMHTCLIYKLLYRLKWTFHRSSQRWSAQIEPNSKENSWVRVSF